MSYDFFYEIFSMGRFLKVAPAYCCKFMLVTLFVKVDNRKFMNCFKSQTRQDAEQKSRTF